MKFLLVTDLDNTLVGDQQALLCLNRKLAAYAGQVHLIYATGRSYASARQLQQEAQLLEPAYWITGVGTEIYCQNQQDASWAERLSQNWDREAIVSLTQSFPQLVPQSQAEQNPWKISFFLRSYQSNHLTEDSPEALLADLRSQLAHHNLSAQVVFSSNRDVDILPQQGDKGLAMNHLRTQLQVPPEQTLVCGDSGNDISLFQQSTLGVLVNNAQPELLHWYRTLAQPRHYLAQSGYAWGILEALFYFNLL